MTANSSWAAHDLFTIRRLSGLCDEIETIVNDRSLAEAVREAARTSRGTARRPTSRRSTC